jgi:hypothetical protein
MRQRLLLLIGVATAVAVVSLAMRTVAGQTPTSTGKAPSAGAKTGPTLKTPWGEPDLQGIWTKDADIPLQRPAKWAGREFFTDEERAALDRQILDIVGRDSSEARRSRGTEKDVNSEYSQVIFTSHLHVGKRTSLIVDPPDGRMPPLTPEAQKARTAMRQFQLALLQPTAVCKAQEPGCAGGTYGPVSARRNETPPMYVANPFPPISIINRADGPEERSLNERCLAAVLPDFGNFNSGPFRRIVQAPGQISMFYDTGAGAGWQRNIVMNGSPHLPSTIRQWWGDSRGRWEGNTLVVDVTNFSPKSDFQGAHEHLHLVERWTRLDADTIEYAVTIDDPTTWVRPWTVKQELKKQSDAVNRIYYEPRCQEGNYGLPALLLGTRVAERAFAEGRGPDPATLCLVIACGGFANGGFTDEGEDADPLR